MATNKAMLVIDLQNDYLYEKRIPKFTYKTDELISNVNKAIEKYSNDGYDIIYIAEVMANIPTNRLVLKCAIKGTEGVKLYSGLNVVSDFYFEKQLPNAFTAKLFKKHIAEHNYEEYVIVGLDSCGCVAATTKGAVKTGAKVSVLENCIATITPEKYENIKAKLKAKSVQYI